MVNIKRALSKKSKGQSLVELGLTLIIIMTLLAGAFDFGFAFFDFVALRDAAQEGAIYAAIDPTHTNLIVERVQQSSTTPVDFSTFVATCDTSSPNGICISFSGGQCSGNQVTVTVRYLYHLTMPLIEPIIGSSTIPLHSTVTNVILTPLCPP
jgi:Flp pilus assembly protein TadG